jgi:acyl carrier protein
MRAALRVVEDTDNLNMDNPTPDAGPGTGSDAGSVSRATVFAEVVRQLEPFAKGETAITGSTVISKDLEIDSLAVMDMVMELEDRFDVTVPLNRVAEIHTVDQLTDAVLALRGGR